MSGWVVLAGSFVPALLAIACTSTKRLATTISHSALAFSAPDLSESCLRGNPRSHSGATRCKLWRPVPSRRLYGNSEPAFG
jgi:hypothetical protein